MVRSWSATSSARRLELGLGVVLPDDADDQRVGHGPSLVVEDRGARFARQFGLGFGNFVPHQGEDLLAVVDAVGELHRDDRDAGAGCRSELPYLGHLLQLLLELLGDEGLDPLGGGTGHERYDQRVPVHDARIFEPGHGDECGEASDENDEHRENEEVLVVQEEAG